MKKGRHRRYEEARALKRGPDLDIEAIFDDLESDRPAAPADDDIERNRDDIERNRDDIERNRDEIERNQLDEGATDDVEDDLIIDEEERERG